MFYDASATENERRVFDDAAAFGLRSGISVPWSPWRLCYHGSCPTLWLRITGQDKH
ncbi:autoinducer binding domain-containing protein [Mesorhizobium australicum]|uniref:autoinducer binding domain-containing protein n=1 Tax=Mesorhizobium australicum TaxID=536018 RepID=UPI00333D6D5D